MVLASPGYEETSGVVHGHLGRNGSVNLGESTEFDRIQDGADNDFFDGANMLLQIGLR
jgi:hypothetical protein